MKLQFLTIGAALLILPTGCFWRNTPVAEQAVIQVDDRTMNLKEFSDRLSRQLKSFDALAAKDPAQIDRARQSVIQDFLMEALFARFALSQKIEVAEGEWDQEVNEIRSGFPDDVSFRRALAEENLSLSEWREKIKFLILQKKIFATFQKKTVAPGEDEMKKYYEENKEKFRHPERILLRQIVVDDLGKAQDIHQELKKKKFETLATQFSIAPEGKAGGLVGWVDRGSLDVFDKAFGLSVGGAISQVLESTYGFHIFKVEKKEPAGFRKFDELKPVIAKILVGQQEQKEYTQWMDEQLRSSRVSINRDLINQLKVETRD
jgi:peptidyl-prolyl cis-trans isomerase C